MQPTPDPAPDQEALLRQLDASLRWCERRARAIHVIGRAGQHVLEGLVSCGAAWAVIPTCAVDLATEATWRRSGGALDTDTDDQG